MCPRYGKGVKFTSGLKRHINAHKIPITLSSCQPLNPKLVLDYNTTNLLKLPSDNNKEDISPEASNNGEERIKLADINNDKKDIKCVNIDK